MKLGDLVAYTEGGRPEGCAQMGLIIDGPREGLDDSNRSPYAWTQWEVYWMYCNRTGWWDEHRMEVISESR